MRPLLRALPFMARSGVFSANTSQSVHLGTLTQAFLSSNEQFSDPNLFNFSLARGVTSIGGFAFNLSPATQAKLVNAIIDHTRINKLREALDDEAETSLFIPYTKFQALCKASGAAMDDAHAEEICQHLVKAGIILKADSIVFLNPEEIAQTVLQVIPNGHADTAEKLAAVEEELALLEGQQAAIASQAESTTTMILGVAWVVIAVQLSMFIWLTWWELSWDVMEPFGYVISLFYSFLAYSYFIVTRGEIFDMGPIKDFWGAKMQAKRKGLLKFDEARYRHLQKLQARYRKHFASMARML